MAYQINLTLPAGWKSEQDTFLDESGVEISHAEATLSGKGRDDARIDIYVGDMPEGETAEDQAFANYADTVGFDETDPEDFCPIEKLKFNNRNACAFEALCEDDSPMRFISCEIRKGVLAIIVFAAKDDDLLNEVHSLLEKGFRV
ncbi:MAG: hypothetical protein KBS55_05540 [Bacteroidales bacterium]|nr:hypothetical protein [Candidatus Cryptobacteroides aphodequi]